MTTSARVEAIAHAHWLALGQGIAGNIAGECIAEADPLTAVAQQMREALDAADDLRTSINVMCGADMDTFDAIEKAIAAYDALIHGKTQSAVGNASSHRQTVDKRKEG